MSCQLRLIHIIRRTYHSDSIELLSFSGVFYLFSWVLCVCVFFLSVGWCTWNNHRCVLIIYAALIEYIKCQANKRIFRQKEIEFVLIPLPLRSMLKFAIFFSFTQSIYHTSLYVVMRLVRRADNLRIFFSPILSHHRSFILWWLVLPIATMYCYVFKCRRWLCQQTHFFKTIYTVLYRGLQKDMNARNASNKIKRWFASTNCCIYQHSQ